MAKWDQELTCDICGKHRGRGFDHTLCSKKRQDEYLLKLDQPLGPHLGGLTLRHKLASQRRRSIEDTKKYKNGKVWVPDD